MKNCVQVVGLGSLVLMFGVVGCDSAENPIGDGDGGTRDSDTNPGGGTDVVASCVSSNQSALCSSVSPDGRIVLSEMTNFDFSSTLHISHTVVKGASPELVFDWSNLNKDLLGRPIDPAQDIDLVLLSLWNLPRDEMADLINNDALTNAKLIGPAWVLPDGTYTQAPLTSFGPMGEPVSWDELVGYFDSNSAGYNPDQFTHMVMAQSGTEPGKNARMIGFFTLDTNSPNTFYSIEPDSTTLDYEVDIRSQQWIPFAMGNPNYTINWESLELNAMGNSFVPTMVDTIVVAHYANMNPCEIEENFLTLRESANGWWETHLDSVVYEQNLSGLLDANGASFAGVDNTGTWIVAIFCGECANPAPWFMTVLQPC